MGFLNLRKNKSVSDTKTKAVKKLAVLDATKSVAVLGSPLLSRASNVLIRPRVTEKATILSERESRVVVFEVTKTATKKTIAEAVKALYKVTPKKIAVLPVPAKSGFVRGRVSKGHTYRKAYVFLKKGDKIEVV